MKVTSSPERVLNPAEARSQITSLGGYSDRHAFALLSLCECQYTSYVSIYLLPDQYLFVYYTSIAKLASCFASTCTATLRMKFYLYPERARAPRTAFAQTSAGWVTSYWLASQRMCECVRTNVSELSCAFTHVTFIMVAICCHIACIWIYGSCL